MKVKKENAATFRRVLKAWGRKRLRDYPWRQVHDRYHVLIAEMMLRRTRADQVVPVYKVATKRYPTMRALGAADPEAVKDALRPLGLSWRAQNIVTMAREVAERYGGEVPVLRDELVTLTGVGPYVASAVACFSSNEPVAIVDTNVVRVIGRVFGLRLEGEARRRKDMIEAANLCLDRRHPRFYNHALLDFAAAVCTANKPLCVDCPLGRRGLCEYLTAMRGASNSKTRGAEKTASKVRIKRCPV